MMKSIKIKIITREGENVSTIFLSQEYVALVLIKEKEQEKTRTAKNKKLQKEIDDEQEVKAVIKEEKELGMSDQYSIITVGKFEKRKGFDLLIEAAKKVTGEYKIYFIGASNNEIYQKLITKDIENKIEFIDFCDKNKLKKYYRASDLFILPTREDIWGLVIPEAMANGIPVVTTDRCLAGVAMLEKNEIMRTENIDDIVLKLNEQMNLTDKDRQIIGLRNINKTKEYSIENATNKDIENFKEFQKNSKA